VPIDNRGYCDDNDNNATEEPSVGMAAVNTVLLMPRQQRLLVTRTTMPQKRPVLAWLQSTLYCWCLDKRGNCGDNDNNATEETSVGMAAVHTVLLVP
jgi:hypothetical protein